MKLYQMSHSTTYLHWKEADSASRSLTPNNLVNNPLWPHGPPWITLQSTELKNKEIFTVKKIICHFLQMLHNRKNPANQMHGLFSSSELHKSLFILIKDV